MDSSGSERARERERESEGGGRSARGGVRPYSRVPPDKPLNSRRNPRARRPPAAHSPPFGRPIHKYPNGPKMCRPYPPPAGGGRRVMRGPSRPRNPSLDLLPSSFNAHPAVPRRLTLSSSLSAPPHPPHPAVLSSHPFISRPRRAAHAGASFRVNSCVAGAAEREVRSEKRRI